MVAGWHEVLLDRSSPGRPDAPCCHPRLLTHALSLHDLWEPEKYPMLDRFTDHPKAWRKCIADYADIPIAEAKVELIRLFYGGKPSVEAPFLLKLCDEVQKAASALLRRPQARPFLGLYTDRSNPEFSRLSALLSFEEAKLLDIVQEIVGDRMNLLLYDGCYVKCDNIPAQLAVLEACRSCGDRLIPVELQAWPSDPAPIFVSQAAVRDQTFGWTHVETILPAHYSSCLHYALAALYPDIDFNSMAEADEGGLISAKDFNDHAMFLVADYGRGVSLPPAHKPEWLGELEVHGGGPHLSPRRQQWRSLVGGAVHYTRRSRDCGFPGRGAPTPTGLRGLRADHSGVSRHYMVRAHAQAALRHHPLERGIHAPRLWARPSPDAASTTHGHTGSLVLFLRIQPGPEGSGHQGVPLHHGRCQAG